MLLEKHELPGDGWKVTGGRTWRPGYGANPNERYQRANRTGEFIALRFFEQSDSGRWLWTQVMPFASPLDAIEALSDLPDIVKGNPQRSVTMTKTIEDQSIESVTHSLFFEQSSTGIEGPGVERFVAGSIERVVFTVACSKFNEAWPWSEVSVIAVNQANKIRKIVFSAG
jgi:hypothetical protein